MSLIGQALDKWLQRQNTSMFMQATICEMFPPKIREQMITISTDSAQRTIRGEPDPREMGAAITQDYTLGNIITGTLDRVPIPRPAGSIGTFHTHPFGWAKPSITDALEALARNDKVSCIGATGKIGTKIACFTPKEPRWSELKDEFDKLDKDIAMFNIKVTGKYKAQGIRLRELLRVKEPVAHKEGVALESRRQKLMDELTKQVLYLGYKEEWRPQKKVNGWIAEPLMLDRCKIIWETLEGGG